jgi:hypothetical protein
MRNINPKPARSAAIVLVFLALQFGLTPPANATLVGKSADAHACLESLVKRQDELTLLYERIIGNTPPSVQTNQQRDLARLVAAVVPLPAAGTQPVALIDCNRTLSDLVAALRLAKMQVSARQ